MIGHPARPRLSSRLSLSWRVAPRTAPDAQWRCLPSFLSTCPDIRVGNEDHCRLFVEGGTPRRIQGRHGLR